MIRKPGSTILLVLLCVALAGCKKDAEINQALAEIDSFTAELVTLVDDAPDPVKGVDDAQQYLDLRKREIQAKAALLTRVRGIQASEETQKKLIETVKSDQTKVTSVQSHKMSLAMSNAAFKIKLDKLVNDYLDLFQS